MNKQIVRNVFSNILGSIFKKSEKDPIDLFIKRVKAPYITVTYYRDRGILADYIINQALDTCITDRTSVRYKSTLYNEAEVTITLHIPEEFINAHIVKHHKTTKVITG